MANERITAVLTELISDFDEVMSLLQFEQAGFNSGLQTEVELEELVAVAKARMDTIRRVVAADRVVYSGSLGS